MKKTPPNGIIYLDIENQSSNSGRRILMCLILEGGYHHARQHEQLVQDRHRRRVRRCRRGGGVRHQEARVGRPHRRGSRPDRCEGQDRERDRQAAWRGEVLRRQHRPPEGRVGDVHQHPQGDRAFGSPVEAGASGFGTRFRRQDAECDGEAPEAERHGLKA